MAELTRRHLRRDKWLLLTCVAVLTAMRILCHPEPAVCLVAPPHESLLDHDVAWNVPVTTLPDAASLYQVPPEYALCALSIAASFCLLCLPRTSTSGLLLLGLTAALPPQDVIIGWTIVVAAMGTSVSTRLALRAVILLIGICFSLETGFLVAACLLLDLADGQTHRRAAPACGPRRL